MCGCCCCCCCSLDGAACMFVNHSRPRWPMYGVTDLDVLKVIVSAVRCVFITSSRLANYSRVRGEEADRHVSHVREYHVLEQRNSYQWLSSVGGRPQRHLMVMYVWANDSDKIMSDYYESTSALWDRSADRDYLRCNKFSFSVFRLSLNPITNSISNCVNFRHSKPLLP